MRITLRQLQVFSAVARDGNVTRAAQRIGLSQAAASQSLADLENLLGQQLFDRLGKRVALNARGRQLLPQATQILDRVGALEGEQEDRAYALHLGASVTAGNYVLPDVLATYARREALCNFSVAIHNTEDLVAALLRFEFDLGIVEGHVADPALQVWPWLDDDLLIIAAPQHPLANRRASAAQLAKEDWILREAGAGSRQTFDRAIAGHFAVRRVRLEVGGNEILKKAVMAGLGLGCAVRVAVEAELKAGSLCCVRTPWMDLRRSMRLVVHRDKYVDPKLAQFIEYLRAYRRKKE